MSAKNIYFALVFIADNTLTVSKTILAEIVIRLVVLLIIAYVITFFLIETRIRSNELYRHQGFLYPSHRLNLSCVYFQHSS